MCNNFILLNYAWEEKKANPITLKVFDKMPGLEAWLIKIVFDLNIVLDCVYQCTCYIYILSQSYSITCLLLGLIVKKLKLSFLDFKGELLIKIVQAIRVQLDPVMCK